MSWRGTHFCLEVVLPHLLRLAGQCARVEHHVLHEDAHRPADEGGEEVDVDVVACAVQAPTEKGCDTSPAPAAQQAHHTWAQASRGPREGELQGGSPPVGTEARSEGKWGINTFKSRVEWTGSWSYWGCFGLWEIV